MGVLDDIEAATLRYIAKVVAVGLVAFVLGGKRLMYCFCHFLPQVTVLVVIKENIDVLALASAVNMNGQHPLVGSSVLRIQFIDGIGALAETLLLAT